MRENEGKCESQDHEGKGWGYRTQAKEDPAANGT